MQELWGKSGHTRGFQERSLKRYSNIKEIKEKEYLL